MCRKSSHCGIVFSVLPHWHCGAVEIQAQWQGCIMYHYFSPPLPICYDLFMPFFCCASGLCPGRRVVVGAKCYFYCKPHCNNNMRNPMKAELTTLFRPPASSGWRSKNWSTDCQKWLCNWRRGIKSVNENKEYKNMKRDWRKRKMEIEREAEQERERSGLFILSPSCTRPAHAWCYSSQGCHTGDLTNTRLVPTHVDHTQ